MPDRVALSSDTWSMDTDVYGEAPASKGRFEGYLTTLGDEGDDQDMFRPQGPSTSTKQRSLGPSSFALEDSAAGEEASYHVMPLLCLDEGRRSTRLRTLDARR